MPDQPNQSNIDKNTAIDASAVASDRAANKGVDFSSMDPQTLAVRAGQQRSQFGEHSEALFLTSSYIFDDCSDAAARFGGDVEGNVYSRYTNPTVKNFEVRLAALEQAEDCVATASGMAAIMSVCMAHLSAGDHIICSRDVFGSTVVLLDNFFVKLGIEVSYVSLTDYASWSAQMKPNTQLLFCETPSNPTNQVVDIAKLATIAQSQGALLVVDNCFCTPVLQQPLLHGADIVIHSATKFLDGQGRCLGGAAVGDASVIDPIRSFLRSGGASMSPFNAWVLLKSLETLHVRMHAHSSAALLMAQWLEQQTWVSKVNFAGLASHPDHELIKRQQSGAGAVLSFLLQIEGKPASREQTWRFIDGTRLLSLTANLGDAKSTIVHPATTTHGRLSDDQRMTAGISDNLVRIAVGLESTADLQRDLVQAANQVSL